MPILPGLSDKAHQIEELVRRAKDAGAEFVCFGELTLRPGRQQEAFYRALEGFAPELLAGYALAYGRGLASGAPDQRFTRKITERFAEALSRVGLPARIPRVVFSGLVPLYTEASVLLEHEETNERLCGRQVHLAQSGQAIAKWAHARLVSLGRRRGFSYRDVESEFLSRLRDGSVATLDGVTKEAIARLAALQLGGEIRPGLVGR
jgi:hypothetical protein